MNQIEINIRRVSSKINKNIIEVNKLRFTSSSSMIRRGEAVDAKAALGEELVLNLMVDFGEGDEAENLEFD